MIQNLCEVNSLFKHLPYDGEFGDETPAMPADSHSIKFHCPLQLVPHNNDGTMQRALFFKQVQAAGARMYGPDDYMPDEDADELCSRLMGEL